MEKLMHSTGLILILLGVVLLLFGIFAVFYRGREYWGMYGPVDYEYPYARYAFPCCISGVVLLISGATLLSVTVYRRKHTN